LLRAWLSLSEIITTLVLNFLALQFVQYLIHGPWRDPLGLGFPFSRPLSPSATLPAIFHTRLHGGFLIAVVAVFLSWFVLRDIARRFEIPRIGESHRVARNDGTPVARNIVLVMTASGGLAGIAGMSEVSGMLHRIQPSISANYGYLGVIVAALGGFSPFGVLVAAILFATLQVGGFALQTLGVPGSTVSIVQGAFVVIALGAGLLVRYRIRLAEG
jgi:ABC-type uncharacterized transport system permease subunit